MNIVLHFNDSESILGSCGIKIQCSMSRLIFVNTHLSSNAMKFLVVSKLPLWSIWIDYFIKSSQIKGVIALRFNQGKVDTRHNFKRRKKIRIDLKNSYHEQYAIYIAGYKMKAVRKTTKQEPNN